MLGGSRAMYNNSRIYKKRSRNLQLQKSTKKLKESIYFITLNK